MAYSGENLKPEEKLEILGYEAYQVYVTFRCDESLPKWKDLPDHERTMWKSIAVTVRGLVIKYGY